MLVIELTVYDATDAKLKRRPYSVRMHTLDATAEQVLSGILITGIIADRLQKLAHERYPGLIESYLRGDEVLKYGKGQVTGVEDSEGAQVQRPSEPSLEDEEHEEQDAPTRRPAPRQV